jgi:hypothetical protein
LVSCGLVYSISPPDTYERLGKEYIPPPFKITISTNTNNESAANELLETGKTVLENLDIPPFDPRIVARLEHEKTIRPDWIVPEDIILLKRGKNASHRIQITRESERKDSIRKCAIDWATGTQDREIANEMIRIIKDEYLPLHNILPPPAITLKAIADFVYDRCPLPRVEKETKLKRPSISHGIYNSEHHFKLMEKTPTLIIKKDEHNTVHHEYRLNFGPINSSALVANSVEGDINTTESDLAEQHLYIMYDTARVALEEYFKLKENSDKVIVEGLHAVKKRGKYKTYKIFATPVPGETAAEGKIFLMNCSKPLLNQHLRELITIVT